MSKRKKRFNRLGQIRSKCSPDNHFIATAQQAQRRGFRKSKLASEIAKAALLGTLMLNMAPAAADVVGSSIVFTNLDNLSGVTGGSYQHPAVVDIDGDGDFDVFVGDTNGTIRYFKNTSGPSNSAFTLQTGANNPFDGVDVGGYSAPTFVDIDGDGDFDAFVGAQDGSVRFYENTGNANNPTFTAVAGVGNPFNGVDVGMNSKPTFVDIDGDGDLDAFIGEWYGSVRHYKNTGDANNPVFALQAGANNPLASVAGGACCVNWRAAPIFVDIDGDGDFDAFIGLKSGTAKYYENTGNAAIAAFTQRTGGANPMNGKNVVGNSTPTFVDLDGDGDFDVVVGATSGNPSVFQNIGNASNPNLSVINPFQNINAGYDATLVFVDIDGDDDLDAFAGNYYGTVRYFKNTGNAATAAFTQQTGANNPFNGVDVGDRSAPAFVDIDGDGDKDAFIGALDGTIRYYINTGDANTPTFTVQTGANNPFDGVDVGDRSAPAFVDIDGDGDKDAFIGALDGTIRYYENTGTASTPAYTLRIGLANPFDGVTVGGLSKPSFVDIDKDGDADAFIGSTAGTIRLFENTGSGSAPVFTELTGTDNPFNGVDLGINSAPAFVDIDGDGDLDAFMGAYMPSIAFYRNDTKYTGTVASLRVKHSGGSGSFDVWMLLGLLGTWLSKRIFHRR